MGDSSCTRRMLSTHRATQPLSETRSRLRLNIALVINDNKRRMLSTHRATQPLSETRSRLRLNIALVINDNKRRMLSTQSHAALVWNTRPFTSQHCVRYKRQQAMLKRAAVYVLAWCRLYTIMNITYNCTTFKKNRIIGKYCYVDVSWFASWISHILSCWGECVEPRRKIKPETIMREDR